jgi:hypothetical protein
VPLEVGFLDWYEKGLDNALAGGDGVWWMSEAAGGTLAEVVKNPLAKGL